MGIVLVYFLYVFIPILLGNDITIIIFLRFGSNKMLYVYVNTYLSHTLQKPFIAKI
jgi:hypothetical protein